MNPAEILKMALVSLGANKLRSFLTMSGITIGVFSVIGVMTAVTALRSSIETGLSFLGSNMFQFAKFPITGGGDGSQRRRMELRRNITLEQAMRYQHLMEGVSDVVCLKVFDQTGGGQAVYNGRKTTPGLTFGGTNEHFLAANQYSIGQGRNFTPDDIELARPVCLVGLGITGKLFPSENPLGKMIKIKERTYTVIGVFDTKGSQFGQSQDDICMVPITRFLNDYGSERVTVNIATQSPSQLVYNETMEKGITVMRIVRGLKPEDENDFELYSNDSLITAFAKVADVIAAGSFVISGIALLAAGVGIMNIMLVAVTERTREIGLRMAVGAKRSQVLIQFALESVFLSLAGGLIGLAIGVAGAFVIAKVGSWPAAIPPWAGPVALGFSSLVGLVFGAYPSWRAARLDPIEALRYQ